MKYSKRILKTVELMHPGACLADIGCDHGYMSILASANGLYPKIYACDIREAPLAKAGENIKRYGNENCIHTFLSDGFSCLPDDISAACICGMGGLLICQILKSAMSRLEKLDQMILGPHSETEELRAFILKDTSFAIYRETAVFDGGKHYMLMDVRPKESMVDFRSYSETEILYGTIRNQTDPSAYFEYLDFLLRKTAAAISSCEQGNNARSEDRLCALKNELRLIENHIIQSKEKT